MLGACRIALACSSASAVLPVTVLLSAAIPVTVLHVSGSLAEIVSTSDLPTGSKSPAGVRFGAPRADLVTGANRHLSENQTPHCAMRPGVLSPTPFRDHVS